MWEGSAFVEDDYRIRRSLTLNLGVRYERLGQFGDQLGRNSSFDVNKADANPPPTGSLDGYIVASNFPGALPPGVVRANNTFGTYGKGQNVIAPRIGFAWQVLPRTNRLVVRGGYGIYYSRPPGQNATESVVAAPFSLTRINTGLTNMAAPFQALFAEPFPTRLHFRCRNLARPRSPLSSLLAPDFRLAMVQQFSLNVQGELADGLLRGRIRR